MKLSLAALAASMIAATTSDVASAEHFFRAGDTAADLFRVGDTAYTSGGVFIKSLFQRNRQPTNVGQLTPKGALLWSLMLSSRAKG
jgi:hypothetical protein